VVGWGYEKLCMLASLKALKGVSYCFSWSVASALVKLGSEALRFGVASFRNLCPYSIHLILCYCRFVPARMVGVGEDGQGCILLFSWSVRSALVKLGSEAFAIWSCFLLGYSVLVLFI
jgi:hypothetical protein